MSDFFHYVTLIAFSVISLLLLEIAALPATTSAPTTHIVSFVKQKKSNVKYDEIHEFDFETIKSNLSDTSSVPYQSGLQQLFGRFVQDLDMNLDNSITKTPAANILLDTPLIANNITDDMPNLQQNTLENSNELFGKNDLPMTMSNDSSRELILTNRIKQSIPVLEPVKHLLNTVRDGAFNHTAHAATRPHHQLVGGEHMHQNVSDAIETEEEREMVNDSTGFKMLEMLGTLAGWIWGLFGNIQKLFAASASAASGASFGGSQ